MCYESDLPLLTPLIQNRLPCRLVGLPLAMPIRRRSYKPPTASHAYRLR